MRTRCLYSRRSRCSTCCTTTSGCGTTPAWSSGCRWGSPTTSASASRPRCSCWLLVTYAWPAHLDNVDREELMTLAIIVVYLAIVLVDRPLQPPLLPRHERGLLRRRPHARAVHPAGLALRGQHDGLRPARLLGRGLHGGHRRLLADGFVVGAGHPDGLLLHRHAGLGARQAARLPDAGAVLPRAVGLGQPRPAALRGADRAAHPLPADRRHGRRLDAHPGDGRAGARLGRRRRDLRRGARLRDLRRDARHDLGQRLPDHGAAGPGLHRLLGDRRQAGRPDGGDGAGRGRRTRTCWCAASTSSPGSSSPTPASRCRWACSPTCSSTGSRRGAPRPSAPRWSSTRCASRSSGCRA